MDDSFPSRDLFFIPLLVIFLIYYAGALLFRISKSDLNVNFGNLKISISFPGKM